MTGNSSHATGVIAAGRPSGKTGSAPLSGTAIYFGNLMNRAAVRRSPHPCDLLFFAFDISRKLAAQ